MLVAGSMLLLLGMAAVAVDYSAALNERRQDVGAADTAALGAALELAIGGSIDPIQAAVDKAKEIADNNTPSNITNADWTACVDPNALAVPSTTAILGITDPSPCISFSATFDVVRVRLPLQSVETAFGPVLGVDQIDTYAVAEATLQPSLGASGGFPAGAYGGTPSGAEFCLKASTPGQNTCGDPSTGNFADFKPYFYTDVDPGGGSTECVAGLAPSPLAWAMANGIDHRLGRTDTIRPVGTRVNGDWCPAVAGPPLPYQVDPGGGYSNADITEGLVTGGSYAGGFSGRLDRGPYQDGATTIFDVEIDNRPLWRFLLTTSIADCETMRAVPEHPTFPNTYGGNLFDDWDEAKTLMSSCLQQATGQILSDTIADSARLTTIPVFHQTGPNGSNACCYDIAGGLPIFVESMWTTLGPPISCTGGILTDTTDAWCRHDAGMQGSISAPPGVQRIESASAFVLKPGHLSDELAQELGGGDGAAFIRVELSR